MEAREIMTTNVITATANLSVQQAASLLVQRKISGAPVLDEEGKVIGMITEADILSKQGSTVRDIMSTDLVIVEETTPVEEIAAILNSKRIKRVPVLKNGKVVGIVSRADIIQAVATGHLILRQW